MTGLLPEHPALQHERAPRPLPLFLELVRAVGEREPELAKAALTGLRAYQDAPASPRPVERPVVAEVECASLRDHGGDGPPVVLIPSLINPPRILDLDRETSLTERVAVNGHRALLVDWGPAAGRSNLGIAQHVEQLLLPLLAAIDEPPVLVGYCLGGTMAIAAAGVVKTAGLLTLATPWDFGAYPEVSRQSLADMWRRAEPSARSLGVLPIEVLQAAFWSLDPERTVRKFAGFATVDPDSAAARRFVALEEWANEGEPLPYPAAEELIGSLFQANATGRGEWTVAGRIASVPCALPMLHITAGADRIAPSSTAPPGPSVTIDSGHVGMIVGSSRQRTWNEIGRFLALDR